MKASAYFGAGSAADSLELLWEEADRVFCKLRCDPADGYTHAFIPFHAGAEHQKLESIDRLRHELELKEYLDAAWALQPIELLRDRGQAMLTVEYSGGEPLAQLIGQPMEIGPFLRVAMGLCAALGKAHGRGLIHRDVKPTNAIVDPTTARVWLTGFGVASRLPREHLLPAPPELIVGTLAYMAPEQTGRVNRSIDSRSDLYSLGVVFYEMLTGSPPFTASDPMEWVHCHIARQPIAPSARLKSVPTMISAITMKLLSKSAEERYQTAAGVEHDLRECLGQWVTLGSIVDFTPGGQDIPDRLVIPEKLYGRDAEVESLLKAFDRIVAGGAPELVLVSGFSGVGKSAVVSEIHKSLVPPRGLFASGKFDQYKRDIPYATLAQAFQGLLRPLLSKDEAELCKWRSTLRESLEPNGQLLVELVPELALIIGEQAPVPELPPAEAHRRFQFALRCFIGVFARPEHPLALFLDDLQWLDNATLDLLESLLVQGDLRHLLLIGAYRDNEVDRDHPLSQRLKALRLSRAPVHDIALAPLDRVDLGKLLVDSLHCESARAEPLATLIHEKTTGNPFFAIQFLSALADDELLAFDHGAGKWTWSLARIQSRKFTDNVADLMVGRLSRLPPETQDALRTFACIGNHAAFEMLGMAYPGSTEGMHHHLQAAVRSGLVFRGSNSYRFLHDRVQEAAYSLIPEDSRGETHLRIGMLLAARTPMEKRDEAIFEIVSQLNRGSRLITSVEDRERIADFNLTAGKRAKAAAAYDAALMYLRTGHALVTEATWQRNYELVFAIERFMAECEMLTGQLTAAEGRMLQLSRRARSRHDVCVITRLRLTLYTNWDKSERGLDVFLEWLLDNGTNWPKHPTRDDAMQEYARIWTMLGEREIEDVAELPRISDPDVLDTLDVFSDAVTPSFFFDEHLSSLVVCRLVCLSLEHGNCDASCYGYAWLGFLAGPRFGNLKDGYRFGQLGLDLVEKRGLTRYQARTYLSVGALVMPWSRHPASGQDLVRRAFEAFTRAGELAFAGYCYTTSIALRFVVGSPLAEVQAEAERGLAFSRKAQLGLVEAVLNTQLGLAQTLRGHTAAFGHLDHPGFIEIEFERQLASNRNWGFVECFYWVRKLQARFLAGDHLSALHAASNVEPLLWNTPSNVETIEFRLYAALAHAAAYDLATVAQKRMHLKALASHHKQLALWAQYNAVTFEHCALLVGAEVARIEGRVLEAQELYEQAVRSARAQGFVQNEALANERAGCFYAARGFDRIAATYFRDSRYCYRRWGADAKARQLEQLYPQMGAEESISDASATMQATVEQLDLKTVIKVSEAISGEIVFERLIDALMRAAITHAGAERGLLILRRGDEDRIEAEAMIRGNDIVVDQRQASISAAELPEAVYRYAMRAKESVLLPDASVENPFSGDVYIREHAARSVLCLPILKQGRLLGLLYLENRLTPHAFTPERMAVLKLLASEAAISMENARLYRDLAEREARIRRLVDANIIGIVIWDHQGRIREANDAFLRIAGYDRDDLVSGGVHWADLTTELNAAGSSPLEKELFRKDGSRVPVLIGVAAFEEGDDKAVAFVLDLTERTRAADALRALQMDLAHANRLATMGQLAASIAHEVNQAIGATRNNAHAALRFLDREPPSLADIREALESVVSDTYRAGEIIGRIRDQIKKAPPRKEAFDVNDAIEEVIGLVRGELSENGVSVNSRLKSGLMPILGDRVQIQQVMLNLLLNAIDAMAGVGEAARELEVCTLPTPEGVLVSVADSGSGICPEDRERIFESFYTTKASGVGIGLSICRSIIEAHGGRLWMEARQTRGAVFNFTLQAHT